jgi:dihydropteroate synthase
MKNIKILGIINCTPNSYYDGGWEDYIHRAIEMEAKGASYIDLGGESTAPDRELVTEEIEKSRVIPVIKELKRHLKIPISIDTYRPGVAKEAVKAGATFLNDITGGADPEMRALARESGHPICVMHMPNPPGTRHSVVHYPGGVMQNTYDWFSRRIDLLLSEGIQESQIIIDPGIGFGKSIPDQMRLIKFVDKFTELGFPILMSLSRKSFMQKRLGKKPSEVLPTTLALNTMALLAGVDYLRVHDVEQHRDIATLLCDMEDLD